MAQAYILPCKIKGPKFFRESHFLDKFCYSVAERSLLTASMEVIMYGHMGIRETKLWGVLLFSFLTVCCAEM